MTNEIKDELTIREEFINEIIETMETLKAKATTQGEVGILCFMLKTARECIE